MALLIFVTSRVVHRTTLPQCHSTALNRRISCNCCLCSGQGNFEVIGKIICSRRVDGNNSSIFISVCMPITPDVELFMSVIYPTIRPWIVPHGASGLGNWDEVNVFDCRPTFSQARGADDRLFHSCTFKFVSEDNVTVDDQTRRSDHDGKQSGQPTTPCCADMIWIISCNMRSGTRDPKKLSVVCNKSTDATRR